MNTRISTIPITGLLSAEFLTLIGNQVAAVAIPILVWQYTHSTIATGIAVVGNNIPFVISALFGGRAIDKFGAWQVSVAADLLSAISSLALPFIFFINAKNVSPGLIFLLVFFGALFDPTGVAARHTLVPVLTRLAGKSPDKVNSLRGSLETAADFLGPVIAVGLISLVNINYTLVINAISFLLCAIILALTIPKKIKRVKEQQATNIFLGIRLVFINPQLRTLAVTGAIAGFVIAAFLGLLLLLLATQRFNNTALFGISLSAFGISATISALLFSKINRLYSYSFIYYGGLIIMGAGICLCGVVTTPYGVVAAAVIAGAAGAGNPLEQTILQEQASHASAGQVFAALPAIRFTGGSLGLITAGLLTKFYSVNIVLLLGGSLLIITAIAGWYISPLQKKMRPSIQLPITKE